MRWYWLAAFLGLVMLGACGSSVPGNAVLSGKGESCTKTADCESGLKCVDLVCVAKQSVDVVEDTLPDVARADALNDVSGSMDIWKTDVDTGSTDGVICQPSCPGRECGPDGCGGTCGDCGEAEFCNAGICQLGCVSDDGCTEPGVSVCVDEKSHQTCVQVVSGCYQWGETKSCEEGFVCANGGCVSALECGDKKPVVDGVVKNSISDMDFTGEPVAIQLFHKLDIDEWEDGCISKYVLEFSKMGQGCNFHLEWATSADAVLSVTSATLVADSFCPGWPDADEGEYLLDSSSLLMCTTAEVADYMTESACIPNVSMGFGGVLNLVRKTDGKNLVIDLSNMTIQGDMTSLGDTELACPVACAQSECGEDGCGNSCGVCSEPQQVCIDGSCVCVSDCAAKECGPDGCGGTCGDCGCGESCDGGACIFHNCDGKECGEDGCGGVCGECGCGSICTDSLCVDYKCKGKECGDDGCGGVCGNCGLEGTCVAGYKCMYMPVWTDLTTNLMWQNPPGEEVTSWAAAKAYCSGLSLAAHTDWRLPSIDELRTLIRGCPFTEHGGDCNISEDDCLSFSCRDDSCDGCDTLPSPAGLGFWPSEILGDCYWHWSSSALLDPGYGNDCWFIYFPNGGVYSYNYLDAEVRCVR